MRKIFIPIIITILIPVIVHAYIYMRSGTFNPKKAANYEVYISFLCAGDKNKCRDANNLNPVASLMSDDMSRSINNLTDNQNIFTIYKWALFGFDSNNFINPEDGIINKIGPQTKFLHTDYAQTTALT